MRTAISRDLFAGVCSSHLTVVWINDWWNRAIEPFCENDSTSRGTLGVSSVSAGGGTSVKPRFGIRVFATLLIDRVSGIISVFEGDSSRGGVIKTSLERARERAKTLKGLKTKSPDRDARGCPMSVGL